MITNIIVIVSTVLQINYFADIRKNTLHTGKSINLALSNRARRALKIVDLEEDVLASTVHMKGRYIHEISGNDYFLPYDPVHKQVNIFK